VPQINELDFLHHLYFEFTGGNPRTALLIILNLILIESLLSIDNAAVLATMVMDLPTEYQRRLALRIGLVLAYVFRGSAMLLAGWLMHINFLKLVGGVYLIYLSFNFFRKRFVANKNIVQMEEEELPEEAKHPKKLPFLSLFWSVVIQVELMDLTFSLDNVFAAVAFTKNLYLVCTGVFIGIVTMRIVAGYFVKLMERFPFLDSVAFIIIGLLGTKLCLSFTCGYYQKKFCHILENETANMIFSLVTVSIFVLPILVSLVFKSTKNLGR
jgi:YkoY family integral membrane protein